MSVSPARFNEAPFTTEQSVGGAEDPVTLTFVHDLLCRYIRKTEDLQKELADTKSTLGGEIEKLKSKVQDLEAQLIQQKKGKVVMDTAEVPQEGNLDSLEILAEVARQTHVSSHKVAEVSKSKPTIHFSRRSRRQYLAKKVVESSKVSSGDDILMAEDDNTIQEKQPSSDIAADKITDVIHT
jgi:hypothetical protein